MFSFVLSVLSKVSITVHANHILEFITNELSSNTHMSREIERDRETWTMQHICARKYMWIKAVNDRGITYHNSNEKLNHSIRYV